MLRRISCALIAALLVGCGDSQTETISDVMQRPLIYKDYPRGGVTYLTFSKAHGFQVNYVRGDGRAWLWYPGNKRGVPELWKRDTARKAICWAHPGNSYNPVTKQTGGKWACEPQALAARLVVAHLDGDPYRLASGAVPSVLSKCKAPEAFDFDRATYRC